MADQGPAALKVSGPIYPLKRMAQNALHQGACLMSWQFGGAKFHSVSTYRGPSSPFGHFYSEACVTLLRRPEPAEAFLVARSLLAGPLMCQILACPDVGGGRARYFQRAASVLLDIHKSREELTQGWIDCWEVAVDLLTCSVGWHSSMAYAAYLFKHKRVFSELPAFDLNHTPVPGLQAARALLEADFDRTLAQEASQAIDRALQVREKYLAYLDSKK